MTTWRKLIVEAMGEDQEAWLDVVGMTLSEEDLDREFNDSYGTGEGCPFTLWTEKRVYFPVTYDGSEWASSVPRNPCEEKCHHVGGQ